jgi:segregation and condensation protein B
VGAPGTGEGSTLVTSDDRADSLADQAAAWVPPWSRRPAADDAGARPEAAGSASAGPAAEENSAAAGSAAEDSGAEDSGAEDPAADSAAAGSAAGEADPAERDPAGRDPAGPADLEDSSSPEQPQLSKIGQEPIPADEPADEPAPEPAGQAAPAALAMIDDAELRGAIEAILLVVDEPVGEMTLAQVLEQPTDRVAATLTGLAAAYEAEGRGFELRRAAGGWRLYTRPAYARYVERFVLDGQQLRLTQAALETLAVVAYKQPVTRSRISAIRGVNCDGVIRTLVSRGLVEECGTEPDSGAFLYRTTTLFLEKLGLDSADELPPLAPFLPDDLNEIVDAEP